MSGSSLSRRGLLLTAGALTATSLSGCDLGSADPTPEAPTTLDPDLAIVTAARAELSGLITRLRTGTDTAGLIAVHRVQLAALQGEPPPHTTPGGGPLTQRQLVARERRAALRFARWANAAHGGELASLLASISAGIRVQPVLRGSG